MPTTTVHIPDQLMIKIDEMAKKKKISRNRFVVLACEKALQHQPLPWPEDFFESDLQQEDMLELKEAVVEMEGSILTLRRNARTVGL